MNQDQQPQPWWKDKLKDHWPIGVLIVTVLVILLTGFLGVWRSWERPFWDWLGLLIIPVVLGLGGIWFNNQARKSEQAIAQDRVSEEALQRYLDTMQDLILNKELRRSEEDAEIRDVARARTLTVLRSLDGARKGHIVRFLYESNLIGRAMSKELGGELVFLETIINLRTADLKFANLFDALLMGANLRQTDLSNANLSGVNLRVADLTDAILRGADLGSTYLNHTDLSYADLRGAKNWTNEQLAQAKHLDRAYLPGEKG